MTDMATMLTLNKLQQPDKLYGRSNSYMKKEDEVLPEFQYILDQPIETVLRLKANLMRCWINTTYKSILTKRSYNTALTAD